MQSCAKPHKNQGIAMLEATVGKHLKLSFFCNHLPRGDKYQLWQLLGKIVLFNHVYRIVTKREPTRVIFASNSKKLAVYAGKLQNTDGHSQAYQPQRDW
jgi:hypothetical protein